MRASNQALPPWWRRPAYRHFGAPLSFEAVCELLSNPQNVARHAFWPLLRQVKVERRINRATGQLEHKKRNLLYAAPGDVNLFSYYSQQLAECYEARVAALGLHETITAYRPSRRGSNVEFALEAFAWMRAAAPCTVYCFDVQGFFDHLDHRQLKARWCELLDQPSLPADHYAIYRALTRYAWVDRTTLPKECQETPQARTFCTAGEFRRLRREGRIQVQRYSQSQGIPQGLAISNLLSNLYMLPFDQRIQADISAQNGLYRRYCDDILIILPQSHADDQAIATLVDEQLQTLGLRLNARKTSQHRLRRGRAGHEFLTERPVAYLGLVDDGRQVLLRGATLSRFHRRMKTSTRHAKRQAIAQGRQIPKGQLRRRFAMHRPRNFLAYSRRVEVALKRYGFARPLSVRRQLRRAPMQLEALLDED